MANSLFDDKSAKPDDKKLAKVLGETAIHWQAIKSHLKEHYGEIIEEWKFYNPKSGWILKVLRKKRNLFFFFPANDYFTIAFVFGDKAVAVVEKSDLPGDIKETLINARKYAEGRGLRIDVKTAADVENIKKLVDIKVNN